MKRATDLASPGRRGWGVPAARLLVLLHQLSRLITPDAQHLDQPLQTPEIVDVVRVQGCTVRVGRGGDQQLHGPGARLPAGPSSAASPGIAPSGGNPGFTRRDV